MLYKLILFPLLICGVTAFSQTFEGTIEFKKKKGPKETTYIYHIKGDQVRLEEYGAKKTIVDIALIDVKNHAVKLISPARKSYMVMHTKPSNKDMSETRVTMTSEVKTIHGYKCKKWVVENKPMNARVSYWVTDGHYDFFVELLATLNRKDHHSLFFQQVPEAIGYFPMMSIRTDLTGKEFDRLEVIAIHKKPLDGSLFKVPSDYSELKN